MFKVGDKVTSNQFDGVGEIVSILSDARYPLRVENGIGIIYSFTIEGRYYTDEPITLKLVKEEPTMNKVTVNIEVKTTKSFEITQAERQLILDLKADLKVSAIKFIRKQYDLGFLEAKLICDQLWGIDQ